MVASPNQTSGPLATALHGPRVLQRRRATDHIAWLLSLRPRHPILGREDRQTRRPGVDRPIVDVPAILIRLSSIESAGLEANLPVQNAGGQDFIGDVRGILPMVPERRLRQFRG